MDAIYSVVSGTFAATAGAKTVLNVIAGANQPVSIVEWGISFDGTTATATPAVVDLCQSTQGATGTVGSSPTPVQVGGRPITTQVTAGAAYSAEPTTLTVIETFYVSQFMSTFVKQYPLGFEPDTDLSGGTVKALAIRVNVSANVNCRAYVRFGIGG
jgi:hypothetical protein